MFANLSTPPLPRASMVGTSACVRSVSVTTLTMSWLWSRPPGISSNRPQVPKPALLISSVTSR